MTRNVEISANANFQQLTSNAPNRTLFEHTASSPVLQNGRKESGYHKRETVCGDGRGATLL